MSKESADTPAVAPTCSVSGYETPIEINRRKGEKKTRTQWNTLVPADGEIQCKYYLISTTRPGTSHYTNPTPDILRHERQNDKAIGHSPADPELCPGQVISIPVRGTGGALFAGDPEIHTRGS